MCGEESVEEALVAVLVAGGVGAVVGGCGFLDDPPSRSERRAEFGNGSVHGTGEGGCGIGRHGASISCGVSISRREHGDKSVVPRQSRVRSGGMRAWYERHCRDGSAPVCRRVRARLQPATWVTVFGVEAEEDERDGEEREASPGRRAGILQERP